MIQLKATTQNIIHGLKSTFSHHEIPQVFISDNGQYSSQEFTAFAQEYGFTHKTSSPHFPQSNGMAERTVKTAKSLLKEAADPHLALLTYRATPLPWCHLSPAELSMGRKLRTDVPSTVTSIIPQWEFLRDFREKDRERKEKQKTQFDKRHRTRLLLDIPDNSDVWVTTGRNPVPGRTVSHSTAPRSYIVDTEWNCLKKSKPDQPSPKQQCYTTGNQCNTHQRSDHDKNAYWNAYHPFPETHLGKGDVA